jgi:hypothetical protein
MGKDELRAFDALASHAKLSELVQIVRPLALGAADGRRAQWTDAALVLAKAEEAKLAKADAVTSFGNALDVLERGPQDEAERALACALWAHAMAEASASAREESKEEEKLAESVLWLATHTPFDATMLIDRALGDHAREMWDAIADRVRRYDAARLSAVGRGEALIGCAAIALSTSSAASKVASALATELQDRALARVLSTRAGSSEGDDRMSGEIVSAPRGPIVTTLLAMTGILFVMHIVRLIARIALAYRRPAEITLSDAGVRIHARTVMLGRTLNDRDIVIARAGFIRATREVRYPRLAFYAGLLALAVGSYIGVSTFVDGVRAASPSLLLTGLVIVAVGIALDFAFGSIEPGVSGRCRIAFVPRTGATVCIGDVDTKRADAALTRLAQAR